ncbi:MAG: metallophosphoesterase [Synergistaceae bacterium]|nr:metallophosphoesterase [Synergistaceae bacterium]
MIQNVLIFFVASNAYLYLKLRSGFGAGPWSRIYLTAALAMVLLPFAARGGFFGSGPAAGVLFVLSFTWVAAVGIACLVFFLADLASLAARLADLSFGTALRARIFDPRKCVPVTLALVFLTLAYSFYEAWAVRRVDVTLDMPHVTLPEGRDRLRLVLLTDIHLGGFNSLGRLERVMEIVRAAEPDFLLMAGDLVDGDMSGRDREAELLRSHGARYGAFAVTGNHEFYSGVGQAVEFIRRSGFTVLRDARADIAGVVLIGLDDPVKGGRGFYTSEVLPGGLDFSRPPGSPVLLLKHRPRVIEGTEGSFDLQLSGHTHGGQIWPFSYVVKRVNGSEQGLSRLNGGSAVYVSNGAGFWGPPLRLFAPPEVTVIDIVRAETP